MDFEPSEEKENYSEKKPDTSKQVMALIEQLKPFAEGEGCTVSELVEKYAGEEEEPEEADSGNKVAMAVARMKSKGMEETEA